MESRQMRKFDRNNMTPSDCVELHDAINKFVEEKLADSLEEHGYTGFDNHEAVVEAEELTSLSAEDIVRFCEIGEYVSLDREDRGIPQQDIDKWRHKREALGALIDSLLSRAIESGMVDKDAVVVDPTIEDLERLWNL